MQRLTVVCLALMARRGYNLDNVSFETAQNDALAGNDSLSARGTMYIHIYTCNKDHRSRPLRLVCHSFTSRIYLTILGKDEIRSSLSDTCTKRSQGEPYNFVGPLRGDSFHGHTNIVAAEECYLSWKFSFAVCELWTSTFYLPRSVSKQNHPAFVVREG